MPKSSELQRPMWRCASVACCITPSNADEARQPGRTGPFSVGDYGEGRGGMDLISPGVYVRELLQRKGQSCIWGVFDLIFWWEPRHV